jgi:hypothetical protein
LALWKLGSVTARACNHGFSQLYHEVVALSHILELGGGHGELHGLLLGELGWLERELILQALLLVMHFLPREECKVVSNVVSNLFLGMSSPKKNSLLLGISPSSFTAWSGP